VEDNTVNGKPLVYLEDASNYTVEDAGQVILVNCTNITVENLDLSNTSVGVGLLKTRNSRISNNTVCNNNVYGIYLCYSNNNTITGNNVRNNRDGIHLSISSNNNSITGNNVRNNDDGIYLSFFSNNKIYLNNFMDNTYNVDSYGSNTTIWNSPLEITYTYDGTTYESYLGNYWDNYGGIDADGDGIGDTHYSIASKEDGSDDYPLMKPFENYYITTSAYT
jgi:parallel beta-helix repeat protein